jgi:muramidase (phage lysozyme)
MSQQSEINLKAFLDTLAYSEIGPTLLAESDNGYNVIVGSRPGQMNLLSFNGFGNPDYRDHPRKRVLIPHWKVWSTAAGRYQILARIFDFYKEALSLTDFSPGSQDKIATQLIRECRALADVVAGRFDTAIFKCKSRWASLPGAGYGQHENRLSSLQEAFLNAGGVLSS